MRMRTTTQIQEVIDTVTYEISELESKISSFDKSAHFDEDSYVDILNEIYGTVEVCGMTMDAGTVLREMDEGAYRYMMSCHIDDMNNNQFQEFNDLENELEELDDELSKLEEELAEAEEAEEE